MIHYKILIALISSLNIYFGFRFFLNVINVLQTSKYSPIATAIYAMFLLGFGLAGLYFAFIKSNIKLALWIEVGPWALILTLLLVNLLFGDYH